MMAEAAAVPVIDDDVVVGGCQQVPLTPLEALLTRIGPDDWLALQPNGLQPSSSVSEAGAAEEATPSSSSEEQRTRKRARDASSPSPSGTVLAPVISKVIGGDMYIPPYPFFSSQSSTSSSSSSSSSSSDDQQQHTQCHPTPASPQEDLPTFPWAVHVATTTPAGHNGAGDCVELMSDAFSPSLEDANQRARAIFTARCPSHYAGARTLTVAITQPDGSYFASGPTPVGGRITVKAVCVTPELLGAYPAPTLRGFVMALVTSIRQHQHPRCDDPRLMPLLRPDLSSAVVANALAAYGHEELLDLSKILLRLGAQSYMVVR